MSKLHRRQQEMQDAMDLWEGLIKNTGGALATNKCRWWGMEFAWSEGKWKYKTNEELHRILKANDTYETRHTIRQLKTCEAYETLGVWLAADGNHQKEKEILTTIAYEWADKIRVSFLSESEATRAFCSTVVKKLEYPLLAMNFLRQECDELLRPLLRSLLPKA